ncbi:MAG: hypothetical protein IBX71_05710 [Candidatus Desulforudis sp.]|nr:hypothetical protein [Desulforudis sp.]
MRSGVLKVAVLYVGAVIGAGFSSGQEILQFFGSFGTRGLWGVVLATALFAYLGAVVQTTAVKIGSTGYREVLDYLLGKRMAGVVDRLGMGMLVVGLGIMLAGSGAIFQEKLGLPATVGVLVLAVLIVTVIWNGLTGVVAVNAVLVPLKLTLVMGVALLALFAALGPGPAAYADTVRAGLLADNWVWAAVLYVSYNMMVPLAVLSTLGRHLTATEAVRGAVLGGMLLGLAAGVVAAAIITYHAQVWSYQVPLLYLASEVHPGVGTLCTVVIWLAVFTTGIAQAHGLAGRLALPGSRRYRFAGLGAVLIMTPVAFFDFATLVRFFYPLFGCLGLVLVIGLLIRPLAGFWRPGAKLFK